VNFATIQLFQICIERPTDLMLDALSQDPV